MTSILRVFRYEFTRNIRRRGYLFTTFIVPILLIAAGTLMMRAGGSTVGNAQETAGEVVEALSFDYEMIAGYVDESGLFEDAIEDNNLRRYPDEAAARAAVESGEIEGVYILPPDYAENGDVHLIVPSMTLSQISSQPVTRLVLSSVGEGVDGLVLARLQNPANLNRVNIQRVDLSEVASEGAAANGEEANSVDPEGADFAVPYAFVMLFLLAVFATNGYLMQSVIEEKESRLIEILLSSVRPMHLLTGKILALGSLGLFQIVVWLAIGYFSFQTQTEINEIIGPLLGAINIPLTSVFIMAIYFVLGYLLFAAFFGAIGAISTSLQEGPQYTVVLVLPAMIPLYVMPALIAEPNGALATFFSIFPLTAPIGMLIRTTLTEVPILELGLSIGVLALTVLFMFWAAGRLFRVQTLLAGQSPRLREIPKLIFGS